MARAVSAQFKELVDAPNERLEAEYKSWLDLIGDHEARANLARHIAAIANYGGGYIVFGFNNDMSFAGPSPFAHINHDSIAAIVKKYLEPNFQCDVYVVRSAIGNEHPVVVIPPHGVVPICARMNGPSISNSIRGIKAGTYYTRKTGPESAPILTASEWAPVIRRCALHERTTILGALDAALHGTTHPLNSRVQSDDLTMWHNAARAAFQRDCDLHLKPIKPILSEEVKTRNFQLSYGIHVGSGSQLDYGQLIQILREVNNEAGDISDGASWALYPFTRPGIAPRFVTDPNAGVGDNDFLECSLLRDPEQDDRSPPFWRASTDGKVTIIDSYFEDNPEWCKQ